MAHGVIHLEAVDLIEASSPTAGESKNPAFARHSDPWPFTRVVKPQIIIACVGLFEFAICD